MQARFAVLLLLAVWLQCTSSLRLPRLGLPQYRQGSIAKPTLPRATLLAASMSEPELHVAQQPYGRRRIDHFGTQFAARSDSFSVSTALIAVNFIVYLLSSRTPAFKQKFMKINSRIARGEAYRLCSALFLHGDLYHLMANSFSLAQMGPQVERYFGPALFLFIYLGSGTLANLATFLLRQSPFSLGASGSTFGLMGAYATYLYLNAGISGRNTRAVLKNLARTVLANLLYGLYHSNVDNVAHVGGILGRQRKLSLDDCLACETALINSSCLRTLVCFCVCAAGAALTVLFGPRVQRMNASPHRYVRWHQTGRAYLANIVQQWKMRGVDAIRGVQKWRLLR